VRTPPPNRHFLRRGICLSLLLVLIAAATDAWSARPRGKRSKVRSSGAQRIEINADESVAEQVNDPTSFLREAGTDLSVEHGTGPNHTLVEWTPFLALPLSPRLRFEAGAPVMLNGVKDADDIELGDIYASLAYIFATTDDANFLADVRVELPTGNADREAGQGVSQWHFSLGSVIYAFEEQDLLLIPWVEYRRSLFGGADSPKISGLLGSLRVVYLLSDVSYLRAEGSLQFDETRSWADSGALGLEAGRIFFGRYSVAVGYEIDLWGDSEIRNAANLSVSYLF
jgi:hypothetical protein